MTAETLEDLFRRSSTTLVATLTRAFGPTHLDMVESVVQEAFVRAMEEWKEGIPGNPGGWLLAVARNLALDQLRRARTFRAKEETISHFIETAAVATYADETASLQGELADDQLKMIFVACHPCNTLASQIVLALRTLCGLEIRAIARALFATEDAIEKRLVLARRRLREENVAFELPPPDELRERLDAVLRVLYLFFNEAYWVTSGPTLIEEDVAAEAMRLATFLSEHAVTRSPRTSALLALMHFHASRFPARTDDEGYPASLAEQDRGRWLKAHIDEGVRQLAASAEGDDASPYHFEAAIAAVHATSVSMERTDWSQIVALYELLVATYPSPGADLSRAVAIGFRDGPAEGLRVLESLDDPLLADLAVFHAAVGDAAARLGRRADALDALTRARECSTHAFEQRYLDRKIAQLREPA